MKNLKKVLALVLVFASLFGLATMASATTSDDYSDAASIKHVEAVDVMSTIGVFDGISGAFSGDSILTREQAAKIITYMVLGKDQADSLVASVAPYTDVARDRWSAGSIAYCKNEGILAGVGNGRFEPNGKLTGVAFAKMCLVALGYDPNVEGLTGSDWAVNTSKLAIAGAKITSDLSQPSLADEMSREDACQMAFNTLQATMVDYDSRGASITVNDLTITTGSSKAKPVASETNYAGVADKKGYDGNKDGIQQFTEKYFSKLTKAFDTDSYGRPSNVWTYKSEKIGTYVKNSWLAKSWTAKASKGEMYSAIGSSVYDGLKNSKGGEDDPKLVTKADGVETAAKLGDYFEKNSSKAAGEKDFPEVNAESGNGVLTELYMDDNGNVWVAMVNTYLVQANSDYNSVKESVSVDPIVLVDNEEDEDHNVVGNGEDDAIDFLPTEISSDDFDVTGVKEGDYLLLNVSHIEGDKCDVEAITYATVQKGTVTEYTKDTNVVMDGTKYSYNKLVDGAPKGTDFAINSEATLVLDTYGYILHIDDSVDSSNYVYIDEFGGASGLGKKALADAYFTDGTNTEISVSKVDKTKNQEEIATWTDVYGWFTYTGSTGGQYTLKSTTYYAGTTTNVGQDLLKSGIVKFMATAGLKDAAEKEPTTPVGKDVKGNDKTIFILKTDDGVNAYTGIDNVPGVKLSSDDDKSVKVVWTQDKEGYAKLVFVDVSADEDAEVDEGTSVADYMFVLKKGSKTTYVDGSEYKTYTVVIDGKTEERWVATDADIEKGCFYYSVKEDNKGYIKSAREVGIDGSTKRRFMAVMGQTDADALTYLAAYSVGTDVTIKRSGSSLYISALSNVYNTADDTYVDKSDLVTNSKSSINLIVNNDKDGTCADAGLLKDDGADYEVYPNTSLNQVTGLLGKNGLCGRIYVVVTEDDGSVVDQLWIYVDKVY